MVAVLDVPQKIFGFPSLKTMTPKTVVNTTVIDTIVRDASPPAIDITPSEFGYTDEQFHADLRKASKWIDSMEEAALKEHTEGKTRKLP
jgi:hypothetical protein